jgi:hypothetical protein
MTDVAQQKLLALVKKLAAQQKRLARVKTLDAQEQVHRQRYGRLLPGEHFWRAEQDSREPTPVESPSEA